MRVVNSAEMKQIEDETMKTIGFNESLIVENVGIRCADFIESELLNHHNYGEIVFLIGRGNNGSDALAMARHLTNRGYAVRCFLLFSADEYSEELKNQLNLAKGFGVRTNQITKADQIASYFEQTQSEYLVIDGVLGLGFRPPLSNYLFDIVNLVNNFSTVTVAIDVPTGVDGDSGSVNGNAIEADMTLTVGLPKTGLYIGEGAKHVGEIVVIDGCFPANLLEGGDKAILTPESVSGFYGQRNKFAHKNTFGHSLIVGGSQGMTGALMMASEAALKVGTGLVTASTWKESYSELSSRMRPEVMCGLVPTQDQHVEEIIKELERWDSIVIGPGMGRNEQTRKTVLNVLNHYAGPVVVDADAIHCLNLKEDAELLRNRKWPTILTPHMGEFAHFVGVETKQVLDKPLEFLKEVVDATNSFFIMKGACTYLGFPTGEVFFNYHPNDGMASGGSGDVLAGMIGGLLAQNPVNRERSKMFDDPSTVYNALCLGIQAHTLAGRIAANELGARAMTAGDIINHLSDAFIEIETARDQEEV